MDTALTAPANTALASPATPVSRLAALPAAAKMKLAIGAAGLLAVLVGLMLWGQQGSYKVLYANLSEKDGGAVIAQLSQMNVPYKYADGGGAILVPATQVHDVRLRLAQAGLPKGSVTGYELMDKVPFGATQFQERMNHQRGLEGELVRSILSLDSVQAARVHLALPPTNGFFREQQKAGASVVLTLHPGRTLDKGQVAGIVHLVASSVPEMNPKAVSVLDQTGALLSGPGEHAGQGLDEQQLDYVRQVEQSYHKRVLEILEPIVGRDNLRATITADIDFSQVESTAELFKPNQGNEPAAVRAQQSLESSSPMPATPTGVPGAATNQPPVPATAPIAGNAPPLQGAQGGGGGVATQRQSTTNFEVDKTVRVTRNATGVVRKLNAAVVVNHRTTTDAKGKTTTTPLPAEEIEKLTALVQESIGFNRDRGDSVKLINAPFRAEPPTPEEDIPLWKQGWVHDLLGSAAMPAALTVVAMMILFGLVRPALKASVPEPAPVGGQVDTVVADEVVGPDGAAVATDGVAALEAPGSNDRLENARRLAQENPTAVANILRGWVSGEAA